VIRLAAFYFGGVGNATSPMPRNRAAEAQTAAHDGRDMKQFTRTIEDFECLHCGAAVRGTGYTNHCPNCLWSLHVDINPGDRANPCRALMEPIAIEVKAGRHTVISECTCCGHRHRNKTSDGDSMAAILEVARKSSERIARTRPTSDGR
jgi:hypothetical protein